MIPLGHTAALVQSLAEMRVTVYAASFFSTQSRGCSFKYSQNFTKYLEKRENWEKTTFITQWKFAHLKINVTKINVKEITKNEM